MMKKFALVLALTVITAYTTNICLGAAAKGQKTIPVSSEVYSAIAKYKQQNYIGVIQDLAPYLTEEGKHFKDKNNKLKGSSAAQYYLGISYAQLGMQTEAKTAFDKVIELNDNQKLVEYSNRALACIDGRPECSADYVNRNAGTEDEMTVFIKSGKFLHDDVMQQVQGKSLDKIKDQINNDAVPNAKNYKFLNDATDAIKAQPTDEEIANAVRVLAKVGVNPFI